MDIFCCKDLNYAINNPRSNIIYEAIDRQFCVDGDLGFKLIYCPWCGSKLPKDLRDEFFDILEKEYGFIEPGLEVLDDPNLPEEFKTDEWWRKRGL